MARRIYIATVLAYAAWLHAEGFAQRPLAEWTSLAFFGPPALAGVGLFFVGGWMLRRKERRLRGSRGGDLAELGHHVGSLGAGDGDGFDVDGG